jgi:hypothetical protein
MPLKFDWLSIWMDLRSAVCFTALRREDQAVDRRVAIDDTMQTSGRMAACPLHVLSGELTWLRFGGAAGLR